MNLKFEIKGSKLEDFTNKLEDLTKISDEIKLKIDKNNILIYSLVGETAIVAFKNYILLTDEYLKIDDNDNIFDNDNDNDNENEFDFIITNSKKFCKKLKFFNIEDKILCEMKIVKKSDKNYGRSLNIHDSRFNITQIGGEPYSIRDVDKDKLRTLLSEDNINWQFRISESNFNDVKKLSKIDADDKIINISSSDGSIKFGETGKWELDVADAKEKHKDIAFPKKYLSSINNTSDIISFYVYETFILWKEENVNFMCSFEQTFEEDED